MIKPKDFTYYFLNDVLINTIRIIYRKDYTVLTVYYPYKSLNFKSLLKKYKYENALIKERYKEHSMDLHRDDKNPYEWHFHLMMKNEDIQPFLKELFKLNDLPEEDLRNIISYLNNPNKKLKNIEFKGSKDSKALEKFKGKLKSALYLHRLFKKEVYSDETLLLSLYLTRFDIFRFKVTDHLLKILKNNKKIEQEFKVIYEGNNITVDLNRVYLEYLDTLFHSYKSYYKYKHTIQMKKYLEQRLNLELSWSIYKGTVKLKELGFKSYDSFLKSKKKINDTHLVKAYFLFYSRFQNCIDLEGGVDKECILKINLKDSNFKRAMEICFDKIRITLDSSDRSSPFK